MTTPIQAAIEALTLAMTICDAVPTRAQDCDDETLAHLGKLVNVSADGATGYAVIRDALAALQAAPTQECKWPTCLPEHEQVKLAEDVMSMLAGETPPPAQGSIDTPSPETIQRLAELHYYQPDAATMDIRLQRFAIAVFAHIAQRAASGVSPVSEQDIMREIYDYANFRDGIDSAVGEKRSEQVKTMLTQANKIRGMLRVYVTHVSIADEVVYQIGSDSGPSGWSDVTKEEFDLHLVTTWRKKRILYAK